MWSADRDYVFSSEYFCTSSPKLHPSLAVLTLSTFLSYLNCFSPVPLRRVPLPRHLGIQSLWRKHARHSREIVATRFTERKFWWEKFKSFCLRGTREWQQSLKLTLKNSVHSRSTAERSLVLGSPRHHRPLLHSALKTLVTAETEMICKNSILR